jgi:hypothetical protein
MITAGTQFIAPAPKLYVGATELAGLDVEAAVAVDYTADRDGGQPVDRACVWRVLEDELVVPGKKKADPVLQCHRGVRALQRTNLGGGHGPCQETRPRRR